MPAVHFYSRAILQDNKPQPLADWQGAPGGRVRLKASGVGPGGFVPEGHPGIARRFNAGEARKGTLVPKGRLRILVALSRPFGTELLFRFAYPALKRRAIPGSPSGAEGRHRLTDSFNRARDGRALARHPLLEPLLTSGVFRQRLRVE